MMFSPGDEAAARPTVLRFLASDGLALALETRGVGSRRVLFAHGFGHARGIFEDVAAALDPTLYTVGRLDGRGAGRSDRAQTYDLAAFTRDLVTALESADGPTDLVAHGLAARAALEVASRPPRWLARLVLVCPVLRLDPAALASAAASCGSRIAIARELRRLASVELRPDLIERLVDEAVGIDRAASAAWLALGDGSPAASPRFRRSSSRARMTASRTRATMVRASSSPARGSSSSPPGTSSQSKCRANSRACSRLEPSRSAPAATASRGRPYPRNATRSG